MKILKKLSFVILEVQSRIILSIVYIVILPLFALIFKSKKEINQLGWKPWKIKADSLEDLRKEF